MTPPNAPSPFFLDTRDAAEVATAGSGVSPNLAELFGAWQCDVKGVTRRRESCGPSHRTRPSPNDNGDSNAASGAASLARESQGIPENGLAVVRLGIATSLYNALQVRHAATAAHGLRVARLCSAWGGWMGLAADDRDRIEVAALLHDVGKIGIPDRILRKPGKLSVDEQLTMARYPELSCQILGGCTTDVELLSIVRHADDWYDGRRLEDIPRGDALPLGARMLAIAGAYDAMVTDHVYRPARSREWAIREVVSGGGTQFDPDLATDFSRLLETHPELPHGHRTGRWLHELSGEGRNRFWGLASVGETPSELPDMRGPEGVFFRQLSDELNDGFAFTDGEGTITHWNLAMERLTSIRSAAVIGQTWTEEAVRLRSPLGRRGEDESLVEQVIRLGTPQTRTMRVERPGEQPVPVRVRVAPVSGPVPGLRGTLITIRDLAEQTDLQEQLESLHQQATRDPLTGVANRAAFDRRIAELTDGARAGGPTFSVWVSDVDHFKRVNDTYGHPAGDEALVGVAAVLARHAREGDLVARYGGEEFVFLAPGCDNATAARRAEAIRLAIAATPLRSLGGEAVTASFGVTEFQIGDSAETVFARADRALLRAKDNGRNRVVQLGAGRQLSGDELTKPVTGWRRWFRRTDRGQANETAIVTPVPMELAIEKLRGFIADHDAELLDVGEQSVSLRVTRVGRGGGRRLRDRRIAMRVDLTLTELTSEKSDRPAASQSRRTKVLARIEPIRNRDRRSRQLRQTLRELVLSLRSYLMGDIVHESGRDDLPAAGV